MHWQRLRIILGVLASFAIETNRPLTKSLTVLPNIGDDERVLGEGILALYSRIVIKGDREEDNFGKVQIEDRAEKEGE